MYILQFVCLLNDIVTASTIDLLEGDNQKTIGGLIISVNNFTREIITYLNILCLLLPSGLTHIYEKYVEYRAIKNLMDSMAPLLTLV